MREVVIPVTPRYRPGMSMTPGSIRWFRFKLWFHIHGWDLFQAVLGVAFWAVVVRCIWMIVAGR